MTSIRRSVSDVIGEAVTFEISLRQTVVRKSGTRVTVRSLPSKSAAKARPSSPSGTSSIA